MNDLEFIAHLLSRRCFAEAAYFGTVSALRAPTALAHMFAGVGCCGCAEPMATAQRLLEDAPVRDEVDAGLRISPATELPYEGFFHLIQAVRLDPAIRGPESLRELFDAVADDLAFISRRELHRPPDRRRRYSHGVSCVSAAVLLRRMACTDRELPGVMLTTLEISREIIDKELGQAGGDATFFYEKPELM